MKSSFEETLVAVWRQALVEKSEAVKLGTEHFPVTKARRNAFAKLRSTSMETRLWGLSGTQKPSRDGLIWREQGRR
jgi:hypothetical protein